MMIAVPLNGHTGPKAGTSGGALQAAAARHGLGALHAIEGRTLAQLVPHPEEIYAPLAEAQALADATLLDQVVARGGDWHGVAVGGDVIDHLQARRFRQKAACLR